MTTSSLRSIRPRRDRVSPPPIRSRTCCPSTFRPAATGNPCTSHWRSFSCSSPEEVTAYLLLRDDGEDTRAEYCSALREFTDDGDLLSAVAGADASALSEFERIEGLAPQTVGADWQALRDLTETIQRGEIDVVTGMSAVSHLRSIAADADQECGLTIDIPGF
ncbi:MAG: hypothetical protein WKF82_06735 [Nocardioidaceae bacterium]